MITKKRLKSDLTKGEFDMLKTIVDLYDPVDNLCYSRELTPSEKGVIGSLVKRGLVYDSFKGIEGYPSNFFPSEDVLMAFGVEVD